MIKNNVIYAQIYVIQNVIIRLTKHLPQNISAIWVVFTWSAIYL